MTSFVDPDGLARVCLHVYISRELLYAYTHIEDINGRVDPDDERSSALCLCVKTHLRCVYISCSEYVHGYMYFSISCLECAYMYFSISLLECAYMSWAIYDVGYRCIYTHIHIYKYTHAMYVSSCRGIRKYTWICIAKSLQHRYTYMCYLNSLWGEIVRGLFQAQCTYHRIVGYENTHGFT